MKKNYLLMIILIAVGLFSCKKNNLNEVDDNLKISNLKDLTEKNLVSQPNYYYVDLVLQPRATGENYDTYRCVWSGQDVKVTGSPIWDQNNYPNLLNGVPTTGATLDVYNPANVIQKSYDNRQDIFTMQIATAQYTNLQAFQVGFDRYEKDVTSYDPTTNNNSYPFIGDYVSQSYGTPPSGPITVTGKLIRVTTGSHWAIATVDYPEASPAPFYGAEININGVYYDLSGARGNITSATAYSPGNPNVTFRSISGNYSNQNSATQTVYVSVTIIDNNGNPLYFSGTVSSGF